MSLPAPVVPADYPVSEFFIKQANAGQRQTYAALMDFMLGNSDDFYADDSPFRILSGHAGTGKTWLLVQWILAMAKTHRVAVCAPTHKAVSVISAKIAEQAAQEKLDESFIKRIKIGTIYSLLGLRLREDRDGGMNMRIERNDEGEYFEGYDLVVIDECSMLSPQLLEHIQTYQQEGREPKVLFSGDAGQLLPVEDTSSASASNVIPLFDQDELTGDDSIPPIFRMIDNQHHLTEIVRQKSTGRAHPVSFFANEVRRYIEGEKAGVFTPQKVRDFIQSHPDDLMKKVLLAPVDTLSAGAVTLRKRFPEKDIRVVAWRNAVVDKHNLFIHKELASLYLDQAPSKPVENAFLAEDQPDSESGMADAPFWCGELMVSREAMLGFAPTAGACQRGFKFWEDALAPDLESATEKKAPIEGIIRIQNNIEMLVQSCVLMQHPYLDIPSWWVTAKLPDNQIAQFFVAADAQQHRLLQKEAWEDYRNMRRTPAGSRRAWAVTRACAPVMHAYSITAHKSQGSTFHYSVINLKDLFGMVGRSGADDYHRALYVAITRASERVWIGI